MGLIFRIPSRILSPILSRLRPLIRRPDGSTPSGSLIASLMALLTVLATAVAGLQQKASVEDDTATRRAELIANESIATEVGATIQIDGDYGLFRRWAEQRQRAAWAQQLSTDPTVPNRELMAALAQTDSEIADFVARQTPLLQPPYLDPAIGSPDAVGYAADRNTGPSILGREMRDAEAQVADAWSAKASSYVTALTLVAVALFFLGLSSTVSTMARPMLALAGVLLGLISLGWTVALTTQPAGRIPQSAIDKVVQSRVDLDKATGATTPELTAEERKHYDAALAAAEQAVQESSDYLVARLARAQAALTLANALIVDSGPGEESQRLLALALDDYRIVAGERPDDYITWWNLGVAAYFADAFDESVEATDRALEIAPDQFVLYFNRALAELALGNQSSVDSDVERGLQVFANSALDANAGLFVREDFGLGRVAKLRTKDADAILAIQRRLREGQVALVALGSPSPDGSAPPASSVVLSTLLPDPAGLRTGTTVANGATIGRTEGVGFRLTVGLEASEARTLSVRLWRDGLQDASYSVDKPWPAGPSEAPIDLVTPYGYAWTPLEPGEYEVEVYLDGATRARLHWTVTGP